MRWTDIQEIAFQLELKYPEKDNKYLRFTDLHSWIINLPGFEDNPKNSSEKILESIQSAWIEERE